MMLLRVSWVKRSLSTEVSGIRKGSSIAFVVVSITPKAAGIRILADHARVRMKAQLSLQYTPVTISRTFSADWLTSMG